MSSLRLLTLAMIVGLSACGGELPTEIVLVVDTDSAPSVMDTFQIVVSGPSGLMNDVTVPYDGTPRTIGLVAGTEALGPIDITVNGSSSSDTTGRVATRYVLTRFERNVSRVLHIRLSAECLRVTCTAPQSCGPYGGCIAADVDPTTLPAYVGTVSVPELCNGVDDDADGLADEDFNLGTDSRHCGACNSACTPGALCLGSACQNSPVTQITSGSTHSCILREGGGVACWGSNLYGEIGDGTFTTRSTPVSVLGLSDAIAIGAGFGFTCAVKRDQTMVCWGSNTLGESGRADLTSSSVPLPVPGVIGAVEMSGGDAHSCVRVSTGSVYCWGTNTTGQIGAGALVSDPPPRATLVMNLANAASVRTGYEHTCALRTDGSVSCWGENTARQLGDGTETPRAVPTRVIGLADLTDATMRATAVTGGKDFSCILTSSGARCWGANGSGQIGQAVGTTWDGVMPTVVAGTAGATSISSAGAGCFACVLGAMGVVSCWGCNDSSQLADGMTTPSEIAKIVGPPLPPAAAISAGAAHACALTATQEVWCWGSNTSGQLGIGSGLPSSGPVEVSSLSFP